ncbi:MAG: iron ABC transporter permease, partial [Betaproteobacteria bacterium]|nr:iron ABC transporter permease [Betaproteobacteria bacterium]
MRSLPLLAVLALCAAGSLLAALLIGSVPLTVAQVLNALFGQSPDSTHTMAHDIVWQLRAPRALAAFVCGALLAGAGVLLQVLLRNPLADPYVLGVSGGAALGALGAMLFGASLAGLNAAAFIGAAAAIAIVFALSFRAGDWNPHRLLLTGVVLSSGFAALISLILAVAPQAQLKGMLFWLMGDLSDAGNSGGAWLLLAALLVVFGLLARSLDALALGAMKARALGVAVTPLQMAIYAGAAAATVAAVLLGGSIGFVGMMAPHALRLLGVHEHRALLPAA